jgi:2,4-dienoyl-CoA reductase-like NADH-dependent reductase (Old Yellow Enzyme family)
MSATDVIFEPLDFRNLTVPNRLVASSIGSRIDFYDGTGTEIRIRWDVKWARTGVGAMISTHSPVDPRGNLSPHFAHIDRDDRIPFWRELIRRVHENDCKYILQLVFGGRHREVAGIHYDKGLSSTDKPDWFRGFLCTRMTTEQIKGVVDAFGQAARRAREAGADGIELHGANGFVITQFLSKEINDRKDEYGGSLENRARFPLEVVREVRRQVGDDFHLQFKISLAEHVREVYPWRRSDGNKVEDSVQICKLLEAAGVDAFHISAGANYPHPRNPAGKFPIDDVAQIFDQVSAGRHPWRDFALLKSPMKRLVRRWWERPSRGREEGIHLADSQALKDAVSVPVICGGGFQTASLIGDAIERGACDAVALARPLIANPDLPKMFAAGLDRPPKPCTYANKCLINLAMHPVGCYDESRFDSREEMMGEAMAIFEPPAMVAAEDARPAPTATSG